jgi:aquaporin Z
MRSQIKPLLAEFIGAFALAFVGTGVVLLNDVSVGSITHVGITLMFGLVVMATFYAVGDISKAHLNPAATNIVGRYGHAILRSGDQNH